MHTAELVPSIVCAHICIVEVRVRACKVEELGIAPNWLGLIDSKTVGQIIRYLLTTNFPQKFDYITRDLVCFFLIVSSQSPLEDIDSDYYKPFVYNSEGKLQ